MMWRWYGAIEVWREGSNKAVELSVGYCGLAGKPEVELEGSDPT